MRDRLTRTLTLCFVTCLLLLMGCQSPSAGSGSPEARLRDSSTPASRPTPTSSSQPRIPSPIPPTPIASPTVNATAVDTSSVAPPTLTAQPSLTSTTQRHTPTAVPPSPTAVPSPAEKRFVPASVSEVPRISAEELKGRLDAREALTVIDTRDHAAFARGHIPGALSIPLPDVEARIGEIPSTDSLVFY